MTNNEFLRQIFDKHRLTEPVASNDEIAGWALQVIRLLFPEQSRQEFAAIEELKQAFTQLEAELCHIMQATKACEGCNNKVLAKAVFEELPELYRILKTDSTWATPANLKRRRTVLIYFSPDCPHCQHLTMQMREKIKQFGDAQIVMITWSNNYDIRAIKSFVKEFNLTKYRNIIVGTEGYTYVVQKYYKIETTP